MCVCSLSYPACKALAPYCTVICGLCSCTTFFPHYLINGTILENKLLNKKCVLFSPQLLSEVFLILRIERDISKNVDRSSCKIPACHILMKLGFSGQIFEKYLSIMHENLSSGSRVIPCGQTDRHDEANIHFLQFCEHV